MNVDSLMLQERNPHLLGMSFVNKIIFVSGGLRSRYPLFENFVTWKPFGETVVF